MKKLTMILLLAALALVAASLALFLLKTEEENTDFGYVKPLYTLNDRVEITDCVVNNDVIRATHYALTSLSDTSNVTVWFETERALARTSIRYYNGVEIEFRVAKYEAGMIEKLIDGEWVDIDGFGSGLYSAQLAAGSPGYGLILPERAIINLRLGSSVLEPGLYRITHYFREDVSHEQYDYETGPTLYTVTHTVEVPEPSGKPIDLYGVMLSKTPNPVTGDKYGRVAMDFNFGEKEIYWDRARMTLEKQVGAEWVEVEDVSEELPSVKLRVPEDAPADDRYAFAPNHMFAYPYIDDPFAVYRLTLEFVENEDGSGERYTLALNLRFSEGTHIVSVDEDSRIELEIVEGDAELFESIALRIKDSKAFVEVIAKEGAPPIAVGSYMWEQNHRDTGLTPFDSAQGHVDRVEGDELERVGELRGKGVFLQWTGSESYPWVEEYLLNNPYNPELQAAYLSYGKMFTEDGEYLITVYYRLCTIEPLPERDPNDWRTPPKGKAIYTTSEELRSVVCRVDLKFAE